MKRAPDKPIVTVTVALTATGLAVARAASPLGQVVGIDADRSRPGQHSRHVSILRSLSHRPLDRTLALDLVAFARSQPCPVVVVAAADDACEWLIAERPTLVPHLRVSAGYTAERAGLLLDKSLFAERCRALGIDVPRTLQPTGLAEVRAFAREVGMPCIVKPRAGHKWRDRLRGQKLLVPLTLAEMERDLADVVGDPSAMVLQELVPGPEHHLAVGAVWADQAGAVRHVLTARKIRQFPRNFGSGSRVVTEDLPAVRELSADVVARLDYRGLCGTEFKWDSRSETWRLIEINARPTLWYDLCRAAGCDLIRAHVQELAGVDPSPVAAQRQGVAWSYGLRDLVALGQAGGPLHALRTLAAEGLPATDAVMAWDDGGAVIGSARHFLGQAASHVWSRRRRQL